MKPLTTWACDVCGRLIEQPNDGLLVWSTDDELVKSEFEIVHKGACDRERRKSSHGIGEVIGESGQAVLLAFLSNGPLLQQRSSDRRVADLDEWTHYFRRLQTPWYEEAHRLFRADGVQEWLDGANEVWPYEPHHLREIVRKFGGDA